MAEDKRSQRAQENIDKLVCKLKRALQISPKGLQTLLIAYQLKGGALRSTASPNLNRFVSVTDGLVRIFADASQCQDFARENMYQSPSDALDELDKDELLALLQVLRHHQRLGQFQQREGASFSEQESAQDPPIEMQPPADLSNEMPPDQNNSHATASSGSKRPTQKISDAFKALSEKGRTEILAAFPSKLNVFKLKAAIFMALDILDEGAFCH
jgi:hypothetical protein